MIFVKIALLAIIIHGSHNKECFSIKGFLVLVDNNNGLVLPFDDKTNNKRSVETNPYLAINPSFFNKLSFQGKFETADKKIRSKEDRYRRGTPTNVFNKVNKEIDFKIPLNINGNSQQINDNSLDVIMKALNPILKQLESNEGDKTLKYLNSNTKNIFPTTKSKYEINMNGMSFKKDDTNFMNSHEDENKNVLEELKKMNQIIKVTNVNTTTDNIYDFREREMPIKVKNEDKKHYASMWEQDSSYTTNNKPGKPIDKVQYNEFSKKFNDLIDKYNNNGTLATGNELNPEIPSKLSEMLLKMKKSNNSQNLQSVNLYNPLASEDALNNNIFLGQLRDRTTKEAISVETPFVMLESTRTPGLLFELQSLNASNIYTKMRGAFTAGPGQSLTICNLASPRNIAYVKPECKKEKGQITCKLGRFTYVINNGNNDINDDVLSKFVALIYRRSLEGDKCFDISIVNPTTTECQCPRTTVQTTITENVQEDFTPVTIVCTPIRKNDMPIRPECGASTPVPEETIYECKWKKIGL